MNPPPLPSSRRRKWVVAVLVVVLLVAAVFIGYREFTEAKAMTTMMLKDQTLVGLQTYKVALFSYRGRTGRYPTTAEGLNALVTCPTPAPQNWRSIMVKPMHDPWGRSYQYAYPDPATSDDPNRYDLFSLGPDGVVSGDDIP